MTVHSLYIVLDMSIFAERLKLLRKSREISQARLAELLNIDPRAYNRWETGANIPHLETLIKIADIFQITLDELAGRTQHLSAPKIKNHELNSLCQKAEQLPDEDQKALILVMDGLIKKSEITRVMGKQRKE